MLETKTIYLLVMHIWKSILGNLYSIFWPNENWTEKHEFIEQIIWVKCDITHIKKYFWYTYNRINLGDDTLPKLFWPQMMTRPESATISKTGYLEPWDDLERITYILSIISYLSTVHSILSKWFLNPITGTKKQYFHVSWGFLFLGGIRFSRCRYFTIADYLNIIQWTTRKI